MLKGPAAVEKKNSSRVLLAKVPDFRLQEYDHFIKQTRTKWRRNNHCRRQGSLNRENLQAGEYARDCTRTNGKIKLLPSKTLATLAAVACLSPNGLNNLNHDIRNGKRVLGKRERQRPSKGKPLGISHQGLRPLHLWLGNFSAGGGRRYRQSMTKCQSRRRRPDLRLSAGRLRTGEEWC